MTKRESIARQAAFKANVTRKHKANRVRAERGEISRGTMAALNAHVTMRARQNGYTG